MIELGDQVVVIGRVAEKLPDSAGKITIVDESQLETAQTITKVLRAVADWMWLLALVVAALASGSLAAAAGSSSARWRSACSSSGCSCSPCAASRATTSSTRS
jgi:hypothetical protein